MGAREWADGWRTVASATIAMVIVPGVSGVTGVVMMPLVEQFGWSRTLVTSSVMICAVLTLLLAPIIGQLIARFGVRRCAIAGILAAIPALVGIALNPGSAAWWIGSWIVFGTINTLLGPLLWTTAITERFDKSRGLALAITLSGSGLAFALFPPVALLVLQQFDWRSVYFVIAGLFGLVLLPVVLVWFRAGTGPARQPGLQPIAQAVTGNGQTLSLWQALRGRHFWQLALLCLLVAGVEGAMSIHLYPILSEGGLVPVAAATVASTMGGAMVVGRLVIGFLQDRLPAAHVFAGAIAALLVSAILAGTFAGDYVQGVLVATLLGVGAGGTINSLAYLTGRYFSLAAYASIFGLLMGIFAVGYGIAPMAAAHARELLGGYTPLFPAFIAMLAVSIVLAMTMGKEMPARNT